MIISVQITKSSRNDYRCDDCRKYIPKDQPKIALFGAAEAYDKPYRIVLHISCSGNNNKVLHALEKAGLADWKKMEAKK